MTLLTNLFRHHKWANLTLIDALAAMPPEHLQRRAPGGFGTIQETLYHMLVNEDRFLDALRGRDAAVEAMPSELPTCQDMRAMAVGQGDELIQRASEMADDARVQGNFNGRPFDMPAYIPLFQALNHGTEHRTNITSTLATYDIPAPGLDLWAYMAAGEP